MEDVLFAWAVSQSDEARRLKQVPRESYAHSYILDADDQDIRDLFTGEEWDAIAPLLLPLPTVDASLASFMHKFADVSRHTRAGTPHDADHPGQNRRRPPPPSCNHVLRTS